MLWSSLAAREVLDSITELHCLREIDKLVGYQCASGNELALSKENRTIVSIYLSIAPRKMAGVKISKVYAPSPSRSGRHADLEGLVPSLGFTYPAALVHVQTEDALKTLVNWYKYA